MICQEAVDYDALRQVLLVLKVAGPELKTVDWDRSTPSASFKHVRAVGTACLSALSDFTTATFNCIYKVGEVVNTAEDIVLHNRVSFKLSQLTADLTFLQGFPIQPALHDSF